MAGMCSRKITHVIFDLDGLLLDTEILYSRCTQSILDRYGKQFTWDIKQKMMGRKALEAASILITHTGIPLAPEEFHKELYSTLNAIFPEAALMPGAEAIVFHLHALGIPLAVATGSARHAYELKVSKYPRIAACFSHVVCADDPELKNGKPAPDVYLLAASRFTSPPLSPDKVLVFEDAPNGVLSGKAAGMNVVMVPDKRTDPTLCQPADMVVPSLENVDLEFWGENHRMGSQFLS
ncbi:hypothetical protein EMCRGX_G026094 [Ephydatia muelleri]